MTQDEKIHLLADKVMGWRYDVYQHLFHDVRRGEAYSAARWNPFVSIADAEMVKEELLAKCWRFKCEQEIEAGEIKTSVWFRHAVESVFARGDTLAEAISEAAMKVVQQ